MLMSTYAILPVAIVSAIVVGRVVTIILDDLAKDRNTVEDAR